MDVTEGNVVLTVPGASEEAIEEDVFYNPNQVLNRDLTIAVLRAYADRVPDATSYLDAMTASGVRGIRAAADGWDVTMTDHDPDAVALARENCRRNDTAATVERADANVRLHQDQFDVVDIDPFGSPMPFAAAAVAGTRRLLAVTATDTAPLCGAHFTAGIRRYDAVPRNTDYHPEMGLRILLSALVRVAARHDRAAQPLFAHVSRHYVRVYLELEAGAQVADAAREDLGYLYHCPECLFRTADHGRFAQAPPACPQCGSDQLLTAGPVWLGPVCDPDFARTVAAAVDDGMDEATAARDLATTVAGELPVPTHYDHHRLCKQWSRPAAPLDAFLDRLTDAGYAASRAHYSGTAFKTDATVEEIQTATEES